MGIITILWEKWVEFRRDFYKITLAAMIAPLMYLVVFGMGIQTISHGEPYLNFLIPGVVSLTTMNGSFNAIAQNPPCRFPSPYRHSKPMQTDHLYRNNCHPLLLQSPRSYCHPDRSGFLSSDDSPSQEDQFL